ncbi:aldo/keto reductase, partial [Streptococcus suis]
MQTVTLHNGVEMPTVGFGVFQIPDPETCQQVVEEAIRTGYRLIDTAQAYGNEEAVGRAIRNAGVPREELFITTKLWISDMSYQGAKEAF